MSRDESPGPKAPNAPPTETEEAGVTPDERDSVELLDPADIEPVDEGEDDPEDVESVRIELVDDGEADTVDLEDAEQDPAAGALDAPGEGETLPGEIPWTDDGPGTLSVAFAGGKGGAGRSLLAANVGVYLSRLGREVVLADLDPGGSNLHTYLGLEPLLPTAGALLRAPGPPRVDPVPGMSLRLCRPPRPMGTGADDPLRAEALETARDLGADVVVLDLGAQADPLTLDAYLEADAGVVVLLPEPVGVERAYAFLRAALYRRLLHGDDGPSVVARAVLAADHVGQLATPGALVAALSGAHPDAAEAIRARIMAFSPKLLVNKCRSRDDAGLVDGIASAVRRRWGINPEPMGGMLNDDAAWHSARKRRPLMLEYPGCALGQSIEKMARRLLASASHRDLRGAPR